MIAMLPKPVLTKFDGDPTKYLEFSSQFKWMVRDEGRRSSPGDFTHVPFSQGSGRDWQLVI
jgi:hypothetical protein